MFHSKQTLRGTYLHGRIQAAYGQQLELPASDFFSVGQVVRHEAVEVVQGDADDLPVELVVVDDLEHPLADLAAPSLLDLVGKGGDLRVGVGGIGGR